MKRISDVASMGVDISYIKKTLEDMGSKLDTFAIKSDLSQFRADTSAVNLDFETRLRVVEAQNSSWLGKQNLIAGAVGITAGLIGSFIQGGKLF